MIPIRVGYNPVGRWGYTAKKLSHGVRAPEKVKQPLHKGINPKKVLLFRSTLKKEREIIAFEALMRLLSDPKKRNLPAADIAVNLSRELSTPETVQVTTLFRKTIPEVYFPPGLFSRVLKKAEEFGAVKLR